MTSKRRILLVLPKVMMVTSAGIYLILLANLKSLSVVLSQKESPPVEQWNWSWACVRGNCVRVSPLDNPPSIEFSTISECRLVCSTFSTTWPRPTGKFQISRQVIKVHPSNFAFDLAGVSGSVDARSFLSNNTEMFLDTLEQECPKSQTTGTKVRVTVITLSPELSLDWATDESYSINMTSSHSNRMDILIKANTVFGARHALNTISQLSACRSDELSNVLVMMNKAIITDRPAYCHRGLLLDTSRTFLPVETILRTLNGMASAKMNVFHWHATDSHSFPLYSTRVPQLTRYGAYSSKEVYMPSDVKKINDFAYLRGIRVILEIDGPAHAGNGWEWGEKEGLGKLAVCVNEEPWRQFCVQPPCGQLNPTNPRLYHLLKQLYRDIQDAFPADLFHMGGDEVHFPCWLSQPSILKWMKSHGLNMSDDGLLELWMRFQNQALSAWDEVAGHKNTPIVLWSSHLTDPARIEKYLDNERYVIQTWLDKSDEKPHTLLSMGYSLIMSTKDAWYLDHGFWGNTVYRKWSEVYANRIPEAKLGVHGGEACMWGELVSDSNIDSRLWPRTACVGERLWSDPGDSPTSALPRLLTFSNRLLQLGISPEMVTPEWCRQNDGKCQ